MAFNYLIGNHDAHGKNYSVIHGSKLELAPFYDLLSTQVYPGLDNKFAMAIGPTFKHDRVKKHSLIAFAKDMKVRPEKLLGMMNAMLQAVSQSIDLLLSEHEKKYGASTIYEDLFVAIHKNIKRLGVLIE